MSDDPQKPARKAGGVKARVTAAWAACMRALHRLGAAFARAVTATRTGVVSAWQGTRAFVLRCARALRAGAVSAWRATHTFVSRVASATRTGAARAWRGTRTFVLLVASATRTHVPRAYAATRAGIARLPQHARAFFLALRNFDYRRLHPREIKKALHAGTLHARELLRRLRAWVQEVRACDDGRLSWRGLTTWMRENNVKFGIGAQFFSALGGAVALIFLASVVGLIALTQVADSQQRVNQEVVPGMRVAFRVARASSALVAATPRLIAVSGRAEYDELSAEVARVRAEFEAALAELDAQIASDEELAALRELGDALVENVLNVDATVAKELELRPQRAKIESGMPAALQQIRSILDDAIDDQFFFLATGHRELNKQPVGIGQRQSLQQVMSYRWLQTLRAETNNAVTLIENTLSQPERAYLPPIRARYNATLRHIEASLNGLEDNALHEPLAAATATLLVFGSGEAGAFALRDAELALSDALDGYLATSRELAVGLGVRAERLTRSSSALAQRTSALAEQAVNTGRAVLLALNTVSLAGAVLIAWLYVGRILLHRIGELSNAMLRMADGDLRVPLNIKGYDEVAEMGRALEVFRKHAVEVQRLNLVEKLAEELREKNVELQKAQDQIVMREKLAALGELTAGVAHEIKNPLNFVNNFSQLSVELIAEIKEILEKGGKTLSKEQREEVDDIFGDLSMNLEKISEHGKRADSIVKNMLRHGRSGGTFMPTDLNAMLTEYARLAYHSVRAANPDFNITVHEELDKNVGMVEVVPQDWSRVLLNLVTNACDATDEKRRKEARGKFDPELWLSTKRMGDEVEIRVRDNGPGVPDDVREKMFNPFFTTKPTDKGTGLGLSISHDIVQQHRGSLSMESEIGVGTSMIIRVPVKAAASDEKAGAKGEAASAEAPAKQQDAAAAPAGEPSEG